MSKEPQQQDPLDYNDGLGELLRGKERREFSWTKTALVMTFVVFIVFIVLVAVFSIGKSIFVSSHQEPAIPEGILKDISKIEKEMDTPDSSSTNAKAVAPTPSATAHTEPVSSQQVKPVVVPKQEAHSAPLRIQVRPPKTEAAVHGQAPAAPVSAPSKAVTQPAPAQPPVTVKPERKKQRPHKLAKKKKTVKKVVPAAKKPAKAPVAPTVAQPSGVSYKLIARSFGSKEEARAYQKQLKSKKIETYCWVSADKKVYVQVGAFSTLKEAESYSTKLKEQGISPFVLKK